MNNRNKLFCSLGLLILLFISSVVSASWVVTPIESEPEILEPLGTGGEWLSGTTTLRPNDEPLFQGIGWSKYLAASYWQACLASDSSFAKFTYSFGYSGMNLYYTDLLNGTNPPLHTDLSISAVRLYGRVRYVPNPTFPTSASVSGYLSGWAIVHASNRCPSSYRTLTLESLTTKMGNPITISDVDDVVSVIKYSSFVGVNYGG